MWNLKKVIELNDVDFHTDFRDDRQIVIVQYCIFIDRKHNRCHVQDSERNSLDQTNHE